MEIRLTETFTGHIEGQAPVRALQVLRHDRSASLVSVQRFSGKLGGRQGSFVLQGQETVENGKIKETWFVVPDQAQGIFPVYAARVALKAIWKGFDRNAELLVRMKIGKDNPHPAPAFPHLNIDNVSLNSNNIRGRIGEYVEYKALIYKL